MAEGEFEPLWRALLEATPITIAALDRERRVRYVNRITHGYDRASILNLPIDNLLPENDRARIIEMMDEVFRVGAARTYETRRRTPAGLVLFFVRLNPLVIDGAIRYVMMISFDITEEHEKRKLREREHALLAALEPVNRVLLSALVTEPLFERLLGEMLSLFDCDRAFLGYPCDPKAEEFTVVYERTTAEFQREKGLRLPVSPVMAKSFELALQHPGQVVRRDPEHDPLTELSPAESRFGVRSMLFVAVTTDVEKPWLLGIHDCRVARVYDTEIALLSAIAARIGDGLRIWKAQQAMRQSEQRFRLLVEHAPEAIVILDVQTRKFVEVNSKASELFGMTREQLLQVGPVELSPATQADGGSSEARAQQLLAAALNGASPVFEWQHLHASGAVLECEVRLLHLPHPEQMWVRGSIFDISERKRAQRENERLSSQLAQAQKMQAIGHLTGGVAHDFNNLLTVIGGSLEMMALESHADPDTRSYGQLALDACRRAAALTQRLLAFSRQQPLRPRATDVALQLQDMESLLRRTLGETVHIVVTSSPGLWLCEVDPAQLESAILNLSINARDAMPNGGKLSLDACNIKLSADELSPDDDLSAGEYVLLSVSDNGTGIAPELLVQVFEPFFTTKEVGKGSGLGLSMVYGFVKQSHGHVKLSSALGVGTTVRLFLPRSQGQAVDAAAQPQAESVTRGQRELVLVVEDDKGVRALTVELLHRLGYRTLAAGDAKEALHRLESAPDVSLMLADVVLPGGKNGAELAREVTRMRPGLPVLFMSGYTEDALIHNGRLGAGVRLLEKPFSTNDLAKAVRKALDGT